MDTHPGSPSAPPRPPGIAPAPSSGIAQVFIPNNGPAVTAYYLGLFSLICGAFLGIPALILGIKGLKIAKERPEAKGAAHAWTGVILGSLTTLVSLGVLAAFLLAMASNR